LTLWIDKKIQNGYILRYCLYENDSESDEIPVFVPSIHSVCSQQGGKENHNRSAALRDMLG
jgi:hypothetical protein